MQEHLAAFDLAALLLQTNKQESCGTSKNNSFFPQHNLPVDLFCPLLQRRQVHPHYAGIFSGMIRMTSGAYPPTQLAHRGSVKFWVSARKRSPKDADQKRALFSLAPPTELCDKKTAITVLIRGQNLSFAHQLSHPHLSRRVSAARRGRRGDCKLF